MRRCWLVPHRRTMLGTIMPRILVVSLSLMVLLGCTSQPAPAPQIGAPLPPVAEPEPQTPPNMIDYDSPVLRELEPEQMQQDLSDIVEAMRAIHPALVDGFSEKQAGAIDRAASELTRPLPLATYRALITESLASLDDDQTGLTIPEAFLGPSLPLIWLADGLYAYADLPGDRPVTPGPAFPAGETTRNHSKEASIEEDSGLKAGDLILSIAGVPLYGIEAVLSRFILGSDSPVGTHRHAVDLLFSDLLLATIGVDPARTHVSVEVLRGDRVVDLQVRRLTDSGSVVPSYTESPEYVLVSGSSHRFPRAPGRLTTPQVRILPDNDVAYIRLDECRPGPELVHALRELFTATTMERLSAVVVDLRFNRGGDSRVTGSFLRYLGVRNYPSFTRITRYSPAAAEQFGHRRTEGFDIARNPEATLAPVQYPSLLFTGQVYVLVSRYTSGAATWFATIMKEDEFGVLVGEPTGTPPGGYGEPVTITTPQLGFELGVSHSQFMTPTGDDGRLSTGLSPDVLVETSIEDVLSGFDRQMAYVVERARRGR